MRRTSVQIFKHFDGNFVRTFFTSVFGKTLKDLWGKYAIIGIDMDIDTREKYRYLSIPESIDKYRYFFASLE